MSTRPGSTTIVVDGEVFVLLERADEPGVFDFDWITGPAGYGFAAASDGSTMALHEAESAIRSFLSQVDPATGHLGR